VTKKIIFLGGVPNYLPGLLVKRFVDIRGVNVYYQPFQKGLDLIVNHASHLRSYPGLPPGYFDEYTLYPHLFKRYPTHLEAPTLNDFVPFLRDCISTADNAAIFEISNFENWLPEIQNHWSEAKIILFDCHPSWMTDNDRNLLTIGKQDWLQHYVKSVVAILRFCELDEFLKVEIFPDNDWLKLYWDDQGIPVSFTPNIYSENGLNRLIMSRLLLQKSIIARLGFCEAEVVSLKTQLGQL